MDTQNANFKLSILADPSFEEFNAFVGVYKFGDPVVLFFSAADSFIHSEILHRKSERSEALGVTKGVGDYYEKLSLLHNTQGLRRLQRANKAVAKAIQMFPNVLKKEDELVSEAEMKEILKDYDVMLKNEILEMDITAQESKEVWEEYDKTRKVVDAKGMSGLVGYFGEKLTELEKARTDLSTGRKPASPLPYWKIIVIAAALVISIASIVYCYKKKDCKWVWDMVKAIGGALFQMLKAGC
jgi:hypothetical protein